METENHSHVWKIILPPRGWWKKGFPSNRFLVKAENREMRKNAKKPLEKKKINRT